MDLIESIVVADMFVGAKDECVFDRIMTNDPTLFHWLIYHGKLIDFIAHLLSFSTSQTIIPFKYKRDNFQQW